MQLIQGEFSPHYAVCPNAAITVDPDIEMNWIVTSYYVTDANNIEIRIECVSITIITDCRTSIKAYYFESAQNLTDVSSLLDQFKPTQLISRTTGDDFFYFSFSKTKRGFYIGFNFIDNYSNFIDNYLSWSYTLYAVSDYQFKLSYTSTQQSGPWVTFRDPCPSDPLYT